MKQRPPINFIINRYLVYTLDKFENETCDETTPPPPPSHHTTPNKQQQKIEKKKKYSIANRYYSHTHSHVDDEKCTLLNTIEDHQIKDKFSDLTIERK